MAGIAAILEAYRKSGPTKDAPLSQVTSLMTVVAATTSDVMAAIDPVWPSPTVMKLSPSLCGGGRMPTGLPAPPPTDARRGIEQVPRAWMLRMHHAMP